MAPNRGRFMNFTEPNKSSCSCCSASMAMPTPPGSSVQKPVLFAHRKHILQIITSMVLSSCPQRVLGALSLTLLGRAGLLLRARFIIRGGSLALFAATFSGPKRRPARDCMSFYGFGSRSHLNRAAGSTITCPRAQLIAVPKRIDLARVRLVGAFDTAILPRGVSWVGDLCILAF